MEADAAGCSVEVGSFPLSEWAAITDTFLDAHMYQTRAYEEVHSSPNRISHILVKRDGRVVAAAQARAVRMPLTGHGVAYIHGGPLWRGRETDRDLDLLRVALEAIRDEYACRQGLLVRVAPLAFLPDQPEYPEVLRGAGYARRGRQRAYKTFRIDLDRPLEDLRKRFVQKWRNCLNKAERENHEIVCGTELSLFQQFQEVYESMLQRKKFDVNVDVGSFVRIQERLPDSEKMMVFVARESGQVSGAAVLSTIGETAVLLFAATNERGMKASSAYLLQWRVLQWLKEHGYRQYDLGGIDRDKNPGVYHFKAGLAGKGAEEVAALGSWEVHRNYLSLAVVHCGEWFRRLKPCRPQAW